MLPKTVLHGIGLVDVSPNSPRPFGISSASTPSSHIALIASKMFFCSLNTGEDCKASSIENGFLRKRSKSAILDLSRSMNFSRIRPSCPETCCQFDSQPSLRMLGTLLGNFHPAHPVQISQHKRRS